MKKKILITGFEAFDNDLINPSGEWVHWMLSQTQEKKDLSLTDVHGVILPVTFSGAFEKFKKVFNEISPEIVLLTGLAKNRLDLSVERIGINWVDARIPDNDGVILRAQKIDPHGPDGLFSTVDLEKIINLSLESGEKMKISTSAGEFVCNDLLYKVLCFLRDKNVAATFIHLPGKENYEKTFLALRHVVFGL